MKSVGTSQQMVYICVQWYHEVQNFTHANCFFNGIIQSYSENGSKLQKKLKS